MKKVLNRRRAMLEKRKSIIIPLAYHQVEYLESTGTQYIDTGVSADSNMGIEFHVYERAGRFGAYGNSKRHHTYNGQNVYGYGDSGLGRSYVPPIEYTLKINFLLEKKLYFNTLSYNITWENFTTNANYGLFARQGEAVQMWRGNLYYAKITYNDELVRDLIPCYRKADHKPGMYDIVNDVFYTNQGTGEFILGPKV